MSSYLLGGLEVLGVLFLVALNAFFVAAEFALVTVRWTRVEELVAEGRFGAVGVRQAIENLNDAIAATQVGITFASLALGWIGEPAIAHMVEPVFRGLPEVWGVALSHASALAMALLLITYLHVVLGEQVPKVLAIQRAEDVALLVAAPLLAFARVFRPFIRMIGGSTNLVVRMLRLPAQRAAQAVHSVDELSMLVEETQEAGVMPEDQATYVQNVFELSDKTVRDVMIPREKVVALSLHASGEEVLAIARETAHTRMPVWEGTPDNIVGIVNTKNLFHLFSLQGLVILMDAMYPPTFVDPDQPVARLLRTFRREKRPMAVVRDVSGKFLGIVTLEDILEEIVGEIEDEHDVEMARGAVKPAIVLAGPTPGRTVGAGAQPGPAPGAPPAPIPTPSDPLAGGPPA
jgi:CBS domain containing-hemolysin-like protein